MNKTMDSPPRTARALTIREPESRLSSGSPRIMYRSAAPRLAMMAMNATAMAIFMAGVSDD